MKNQIIKISIISLLFATSIVSCKKDPANAPKPDEQELITTLKIQLTETATSISQTFEYKVENGFGGVGGTIKIDTLKLKANTAYNAVLSVLNEKADPVENITNEIIEKNEEHLFLFLSSPASGNGSVVVSEGNKDNLGKPFNQTFTLNSNGAGKGQFQIVLLHLPTNKDATSTETAGGETDLAATFPLVID